MTEQTRRDKIIRHRGLLATLLVVGMLAWGFFSYVRILSIDVNSARVQKARRIFGFEIGREIRETAVTKTLLDSGVLFDSPQWKTDATFTFFSPGISPHYQYPGAVHHVDTVEYLFKTYEVDDENRLKISAYTIEWLQGDNGRFVKDRNPIVVWERLMMRGKIETTDSAALNRSLHTSFPASPKNIREMIE